MTRTERIRKLCNAIKNYRGVRDPQADGKGRWVRSPRPTLKPKIYSHLVELGLNPEEQLKKIDGFKTYLDFHMWAKGLS